MIKGEVCEGGQGASIFQFRNYGNEIMKSAKETKGECVGCRQLGLSLARVPLHSISRASESTISSPNHGSENFFDLGQKMV